MGLLDELKKYFALRGETLTREEIAEVVADGIFKGDAEADTNPGIPTNPQWYAVSTGVTYQYFLGQNGLPIDVPNEVTIEGEKKLVVAPRLTWNESYWRLKYEPIDKPLGLDEEPSDKLIRFIDTDGNELAFFDKNGDFSASFKKNSIPVGSVYDLQEKLDSVPKEVSGEYLIRFEDPEGNIIGYFDKNGVFRNNGLEDNISKQINGIESGVKTWSLEDNNLKYPTLRNKDGITYRVKSGLLATGNDVPNVSTVWEELNPNDKKIIGYQNRLANTELSTYENSTAQVIKEVVFNAEEIAERPYSRIPSVLITQPQFTVIIACEKRQLADDFGFMDLMVKRKVDGGSEWTTVKLEQTNSGTTYKRYMNPSFVVDRQGKHGTINRIYLFVCAFTTEVGFANVLSTAAADLIYYTSDDDGVTWSNPTSIKQYWDLTKAKFHLVSPANGVQLTDGTLVFPSFAVVAGDTYYRSSVFYKRPNENWKFSELGQGHGENESTVFETNTPNEIILNTRGWTADALRGAYTLNWATNKLEAHSSHLQFRAGINCQMSITKGVVGGKAMYLMTFPDSSNTNTSTNVGDRKNPTVWGSLDGIKWVRLYRLAKVQTTNGYSVASVINNGRIVVIYELLNGVIEMQEITGLSSIFKKHMETQYTRTAEDKIQDLINRYLV